ncbi:hypothetical protein V6N13_114538 [Hibiscus sabdariffa]|uniref:Uncharacterized protein n=1 Tax=Hibiscus sabdariffa TaxID=183260 RepID=A0ABR2U2T2_9ROSI
MSHKKSTTEELLDNELPLKFVEVDEEQSKFVFSNRKAMTDSQAQLGIISVVLGTVRSLKPYGALIDIGEINGLSASFMFQILLWFFNLVMVLSHNRERGHFYKELEPIPGDMIRNSTLVFGRQRIAQAEAMACADMLRFQHENGLTLNLDRILGPFTADLPI